jgi:hypothetical protein
VSFAATEVVGDQHLLNVDTESRNAGMYGENMMGLRAEVRTYMIRAERNTKLDREQIIIRLIPGPGPWRLLG